MKSPKSKKPDSLRNRVLEALLTEGGKVVLRIIGAVALGIIMRHGGDVTMVPQVLLV